MEKPRFVIHGYHEGHQVELFLYDEDFDRVSSGEGTLFPEEVGGIQYAISLLHEHGVTPYTPRKETSAVASNSENSNVTTRSNNRANNADGSFTCPEHGNRYIVENRFEKGLMKCGIFEEVGEISNRPSWAKDKPSESKGKWFWNCKYKEWPAKK